MNYPELNLEEALQGAPILMIWEANHMTKGWLYKSKGEPNLFIFETEKGQLHHLQKEEIKELARMWVEPVVFEHWSMLAEDVSSIFKFANHGINMWSLRNSDGVTICTKSQLGFSDGFFPDCPVGTVINRPNGGN